MLITTAFFCVYVRHDVVAVVVDGNSDWTLVHIDNLNHTLNHMDWFFSCLMANVCVCVMVSDKWIYILARSLLTSLSWIDWVRWMAKLGNIKCYVLSARMEWQWQIFVNDHFIFVCIQSVAMFVCVCVNQIWSMLKLYHLKICVLSFVQIQWANVNLHGYFPRIDTI